MTGNSVALGEVYEIRLKADDTACGCDGLHQNAVLVVLHVDDFGFAASKVLQDVAKIFWWNIDIESFHRLQHGTIFVALEDDLGA